MTSGYLTLIHNEFLKIATTRIPFLLLAASQAVVVLGVSGAFISGSDPQDPETALIASAHIGIVSIFSLVLGIMAVAGEYRHKTITDTYLATPWRGRVVAAKVIPYSIAGGVIGVVAIPTALITLATWLSVNGVAFDITMPGLWATIVGCVVWNVCFAAVGVGIGALVRNLSGAVAGALVWIALVEGLVGQVVGDASRWLPFRAGAAMEGLPSPGVAQLSQWTGGAVLVVYALAFIALAVTTSMQRDVT